MKIRRSIIETEIEIIFAELVDKKSLRLMIQELYDDFIQLVVDVLNDESQLEYPEKIHDAYMEKIGGKTLYFLLGDMALEWVSKVRHHTLLEGYPNGTKFKFKRSPYSSAIAIDEIVIDLDYTVHCHQKKNVEVESVYEINDDNPDLEILNEYYELEDKRERGKSTRRL